MRLQTLYIYLRPYRVSLFLASVFMLAQSLVSLCTPWLAGHFAAGLMAERTDFGFTSGQILSLWLLLFAVQALVRFFSTYLLTRAGARILAKLSGLLYDHLQTLPLAYFRQRKRGDVLALLSNDVAIISHFVTGTLVAVLPTLLVLFGAYALMATIDTQIALLVAALMPLFFIVLKLLGRGIRPLSHALAQKQADLLGLAEENLGLLPLIKSFNRGATESQRFQGQTLDVLRLRVQQLKLQAVLGPALQLLSSAGILLILWISSQHLVQGDITLPELISLLLYGVLFARPVSGLANLYGDVQQARGASKRLRVIFDVAREPEESHALDLPRLKGGIRLSNVHFNYPDQTRVLAALNLQVEAGETIAITGANGGGKSTLLHLLLRFADPGQGSIEFDGHDTRNATLNSLRSQVGFVAQHVLLADATIEENIRYGRPDASLQDVEKAAKAAHAHAFILQLPKGYNTQIGEQGLRLSGGQRQRIALARALLIDPPILLLDETTAMFDPQGEEQFVEKSAGWMQTRTVIMISHRPSNLALADRVFRMEEGCLVPQSVPSKI
ncbi:MAG: ABC transporter ATP-binding protein [Porticoccaceae bacterium]|nr:ABC transporter ATP-binding protein [Porticoccaceae bacterium]